MFHCSVAFFSLILQMGQRGQEFQENKPGMCLHFWKLATTMVQHRCGKSLTSNKNDILKGRMLHNMPLLLLFYFRCFIQQLVSNTPQQSPRWATDVPVPRFQVPLVPEIFHTPLNTDMSLMPRQYLHFYCTLHLFIARTLLQWISDPSPSLHMDYSQHSEEEHILL